MDPIFKNFENYFQVLLVYRTVTGPAAARGPPRESDCCIFDRHGDTQDRIPSAFLIMN